MTIGDRIRIARAKRRWSQKQLGELVEVSGQQIQKWETADRIEVHRLLAIAQALEVPLTELLPEAERLLPRTILQRSPDEEELLAWYRQLTPAQRQRAIGLLQGMAVGAGGKRDENPRIDR